MSEWIEWPREIDLDSGEDHSFSHSIVNRRAFDSPFGSAFGRKTFCFWPFHCSAMHRVLERVQLAMSEANETPIDLLSYYLADETILCRRNVELKFSVDKHCELSVMHLLISAFIL